MANKNITTNKYRTILLNNKNFKNFPYYLNEYSFNYNKKLVFETDKKLSEILILYTINGKCEFINNDKSYNIISNDLVITGFSNTLRFLPIAQNKWEYVYIIIDGTHARLMYNMIRTKNKILKINALSSVPDIIFELINIDKSQKIINNVIISNLISNLLTELFFISNNIIECKNIIPARDSDVKSAKKFIADNYQDNSLTIDTICNKVCFSKNYFCKVFKEQTGISIHKYLNEYRVNKSKELLSYTKISINSVALNVGFKNELSYIRSFKKFTNMTPSEYRKYV